MKSLAEAAISIRPATLSDVPAILEIFNAAIIHSTAAFYLEPRTLEQQTDWFETHGPRHPVLVASDGEEVVGWTSLNPWSDRPAYDATAETTVYVKETHGNRGIGRRLKQTIIDEARRLGFHTLIARVAEGSEASLHLNLDMGFEMVGSLREVGRKFGRYLDVHILQLMLNRQDTRD